MTSPCAPHWGWTGPWSHLRAHHHRRQAGLASAVLSIKERKSAAELARAPVGAPGCSVLNWLRGVGGSLVPRSQGLEGRPPQESAGPKVGRGEEEGVGGGEDAGLQCPRPPASAPRPGPRSPLPAAGSPRALTSPQTTSPGLGPHHQAPASIPLSAAPGHLFAAGSCPQPGPSSCPGPGSAPRPPVAPTRTFPPVPGSGPLTATSGPALPAPAASPRPRPGSHPRPQLRPRPGITSTPRAPARRAPRTSRSRFGSHPLPQSRPGPGITSTPSSRPGAPPPRRPAPNRVPGPGSPPPASGRAARPRASSRPAAGPLRPRAMGSGSSRSGRALRRLRSPDSLPAGPDGAAPEGGTGPPVSAPAAAAREEAQEAAAGTDPGPAAPPDGGDETLRLLDQLLAESAGWGPGELAPRGPARPRPAAGAGSPVSVGTAAPVPAQGGGALPSGPHPAPCPPAPGVVPPCAPCSLLFLPPPPVPARLPRLARCPVPVALCHPPSGRPRIPPGLLLIARPLLPRHPL